MAGEISAPASSAKRASISRWRKWVATIQLQELGEDAEHLKEGYAQIFFGVMLEWVPDVKYVAWSIERGADRPGPAAPAVDLNSSSSSSSRQVKPGAAPPVGQNEGPHVLEEDDGSLRDATKQSSNLGHKAGNLHMQIYFETSKQHQAGGMVKLVAGKIHYVAPAYNPKKARAYAMKKDETWIAGPFEYGTQSSQGVRNELIRAADAIAAGGTYRSLRQSGEHHVACAKHKAYLTELELDSYLKEAVDIVWPIELFGHTMNAPDPKLKKRHLWVVAPPDWGKTFKVGELLGGKKVCYFTGARKNRYERYAGEELLIYDDCNFNFVEMSQITGTNPWPIPLEDCRYVTPFLRPNSSRNVIVLSNHTIEQHGFSPEHVEALMCRFVVIDKRPVKNYPIFVPFKPARADGVQD